MRKSGKLLLGVLSVAALIGTGMGAFIINGTYGTAQDSITVGTTEEYYSRGFEIKATKPTDAKIEFDGDGGTLGFTYTVSAEAVTGGLAKTELYKTATWATVAEEYRPNLKISAEYSGTNQAEFEKYVVLPADVTIDYTTWLAEGLVDDGYKHDFAVQWNSANLDGCKTPNAYFATVDNATGQKVLDEIKAALANATIVVKFEAGYFDSTVTPTPDPVETTGVVTLPDATSNALLAITGTQEDGTIEAGEQTLSLTLEEGYELDTDGLKVSVDGQPAVAVSVSEVQSDVMSLKNPGKKYTGKYTFVKGSTYAFSVSVKEIQTIPPVETKYANVSLGATENGTIIYQAGKVEVNSTVTFKVTPDQYYKVDTVSYTLDGGDPQVLVADDNGDYSFLAAKENGEYLINATFVLDEANLPYTKISALNTAIDGISSYTGYLEASYVTRGYVTGWTDVNTNYNSRTNVYIADGENAIVLYSVPTDKLADIQIGDLVQVNAVASSVGKYSSTKQIIFNKDGATNTITEVDSDATVAVPSSIVLNDETQASVSFDTTAGQARRVEISNAVFKNIGGHSNRYAYFTVNTVEYSIYLTQADNACYDEIVSLAEGNKFTCTAFVGQFSGDLQFIGVTDLVVDYDNPVSVAFDETVGETLNVGSSVKLSATVSPATAKQSVTYSIIDGKDFASLDADGATLTGTSAGTVTVRATVNQDVYVDKEITIKAAAATVLLKSYSYLAEDAAIPEWTGWGREIKTAADIVTNILYTVDGAQTDDFITAGNTTPSKVYANEDTANKVTPGIRMGTGSLNGSFSINTASPVVKIVLKVVPHNNNGNSFNIYNSSDSGAAAVNVAMDKSNTTSVQELTFEFSAASTYFKFESIQRCAIFGINFYGLAS